MVRLCSLLILVIPVTISSAHDLSKLNDFAVSLFCETATSEGPQNTLLGPLSVTTALSILMMGARGESWNQLSQNLWHEVPEDEPDYYFAPQLFRDLIDKMMKNSTSLTMANAIFVQKREESNEVFEKYKEDAQHYFDAEIRDVDFNQPVAVKQEVNEWASNHTNGVINKLLDEPPMTFIKFLILNAIHFKGKWIKQFDPQQTVRGTFYSTGNVEQDAQFMTMTNQDFVTQWIDMGDGNTLQMLELDYTSDQSMIILLPDRNDGLDFLLKPEKLNELLTNFGDEKRNQSFDTIKIPKFTIDTDSISLKEVLLNLGIIDIFSSNADLSGINDSKNLIVDDILHKVVVKVDEEGTEAAAVTEIDVQWKSMWTNDFIAEHPFLFVICDKVSSVILFIGRVESV